MGGWATRLYLIFFSSSRNKRDSSLFMGSDSDCKGEKILVAVKHLKF